MKEITRIMYHRYALNKLKADFMGYVYYNPEHLSYHHLIVPRRLGGERTIENGALLVQHTAHDYLHTIERYDLDMFNAITKQMIQENENGYLDMEHFRVIDDILNCFEREYIDAMNKKGRRLIKYEYIDQRLLKRLK